MKKEYSLLGLIAVLFLVTRLYKITDIPPSLYWDEASIGYNAYSILETGRDEWGEFLPLHFRAFGEFKLPVYIYSVAFAQFFLGPSELAVRIPAVIFSLGAVLLTFLICLTLLKNTFLALFSSLLLVITPWFFIFSRTGYEATVGLAFFLLGIYLMLKSFNRPFLISLSALSFISSAYSYNSYRVILPILLPVLIFLFFSRFRIVLSKSKVAVIISVIFILVSLVPIIRVNINDYGMSRLRTVSILRDNHKMQDIPIIIVKSYLSHFNPNFLFIRGDANSRSHYPLFGEIYILQLPLMLIGLYLVFGEQRKELWMIVAIILVSFLPSAITAETPHSLRSLSAVPLISMLSAFGLKPLVGKSKFIWLSLIAVTFLLFFTQYFVSFVTNYAKNASQSWQYGYKRLFLDYQDKFQNYDTVIISDEYAQPYIFYLYYLKITPQYYQKHVKYNDFSEWGFSKVSEIGNLKFNRSFPVNAETKNQLIFSSKEIDFLNNKPKETIQFLDGSVAFWVYEI